MAKWSGDACLRQIVAMLCILCAHPSPAADSTTSIVKGTILTGSVKVTDGDTLRLQDVSHGSVRIRLFGIDAPELDQTCSNASGRWDCGRTAKQQLEEAVGGRPVSCLVEAMDRYGRVVARCSAAGVDINEHMVRAGMAVATPQYSKRYVAVEEQARADRVGIWAGSFTRPEDYRREKRR